EAIARNIFGKFRGKVPIIVIILGGGGSGGALGIGGGGKGVMLENTWDYGISPESASSILLHRWGCKEIAADSLKLTSVDMKKNHLIDDVIPEPLGDAHYDRETTFETVKKTIVKTYAELSKKSIDKLLIERMEKYEKMGEFSE